MQRYQPRLMVKTTVGKDEQGRAGLKTPVYEAETKQFRSTDEILRNTLLQQLFSPQELTGLLLVKVKNAQQSDEEAAVRNQPAQQLKNQRFKDGVDRWLVFSSGDNYYFADKPLAQQIRRLFRTEPDTAFRYGSLLTSECYDGAHRLENLKIKLVDFQDPQYAQFKTGDCHGKISPHRIKELGGRRGRPFQFRLGYRALWSEGSEQSPQLDFLAKGTLLADKQLTDDQGYDLILDRSSIKGVNKAQLDQLFPCGDYRLPKAAMGNRSNAQVRPYQNSWQFNLWYSEQAVLADCGQPTRQSLNELTGLMKRPLALLNHLVERSDQQQHRALDDETSPDPTTEASTEPIMISIARADKYGQLLYHPKVVDFIARQTRNEFVNAAVRTGLKHSSGMAMPAPDEGQGGLQRGQVCVPHLPEGEVILTRYPIVNGDNIRRYENVHHPTLSRTRGVVWIRPEDCKTYHQGDFDGDQLVVTPAARLPYIARETLRAGEPGRFKPVKQRPKLAYREVCNGDGRQRYQGALQNAQIAFDSSRNSVGRIAAQIGRIQASQPIKAEEAGLFQRLKTKLLDRLFTALQVEVDYQKSAERFSDVPEIGGDRLLIDAKQWGKHHPCHFFDVYKNPNLYRLFPLPDESSSISVVAREIVNPQWRTLQLVAKDRSEYRYLFEVPSHKTHTLDAIKAWKAQYGDWADDLKRRFEQDRKDIKSRLGDQPQFFKELNKLYDSYRAEVQTLFPTSAGRMKAAGALWHKLHTESEAKRNVNETLKLAQSLHPTFQIAYGYQNPTEAIGQDRYVLSVPLGPQIMRWKQSLDKKGVAYTAVADDKLPTIDFVLKTPSPKLIDYLTIHYGDKDNLHVKIPADFRPTTPNGLDWVVRRQESGKAALVFNVFSEEICKQLEQFELKRIRLRGIKHNDFKQGVPDDWRGRTLPLQVSTLQKAPSDPNYLKFHGSAVVATTNGRILGTFSPDTPKLPIGARFKARVRDEKPGVTMMLKVDTNSIELPDASPQSLNSLQPKTRLSQPTPTLHPTNTAKPMAEMQL